MTENNEILLAKLFKKGVDEFLEALDEFGRKNKKHNEKLKELRKKSKQVDAEFRRHLKEKYGGVE